MNFYQDGQRFALRQLRLEKFAAPSDPSSLFNRTGPGGTFSGLAVLDTKPIAAKPPTLPKPATGPGQPAQNPRQTQPAVGQMAQKPTTMPTQSIPKAPTTTQAPTPVTKPTAAGPKPTVSMPPAPKASDFGSAPTASDFSR